MTRLTHEEMVRLLKDALAFGIAGDASRSADALAALGGGADNNDMFGACCALGESGKRAIVRLKGSGTVVLHELVPGGMAKDPANMFALRFLAMYANHDQDTALALFNAAVRASGIQYIDSVGALLTNVKASGGWCSRPPKAMRTGDSVGAS